jgi:hypothetical protein
MTTWKKLITEALALNKESWADIVSIAPKDGKWLNYLFDDSYGKIQGESFTVWTKTRVYFPACFDGCEWVESLSRNPDDNATLHVGG